MSKYRILIIDDDDDARHLLAVALSGQYEIVEAYDGLDALSKLETHEPDFAIIDIMMPLMDGYQVCEAIRRHRSFKTMQVMFLSAHGSKEQIKKSYEVGANLFMTKPVEPDRVLKNIDFTIQHDPPPMRHKRYTLAQLERMEREGKFKSDPDLTAQKTPPSHPAPTVQRASSASPATPPPSPVPSSVDANGKPLRPRVLAVDDDPELLKMLELALRDDFEITTASNGLEAIERMVDYEPDLMLLDIMMPKMNGYQLLQSIRRNPFSRDLPVLVLSAKSSPKDREYAARLGATHFLPKPYRVDDLNDLLAKLTTAPGFQVRPKKLSLVEIVDRELHEEHDRQVRKDNQPRHPRYGEIREIIDEGSGRGKN